MRGAPWTGEIVRSRCRLSLVICCALISSFGVAASAQEIVVAGRRATHLRPEIAVAPDTGKVLVTWLRQTTGPPQLVARLLKRHPDGTYRRRKIFAISTLGSEASAQSVFWLPHTGEFGVAYGEGGDSLLAKVNASGGRVRPDRFPVATGRASPVAVVRSDLGKRVFVFMGSTSPGERSSQQVTSTLGWTWHTKQLGRRGSGVLDISSEFDEPVTLEVAGVLRISRHDFVVLANHFGGSQGVIAIRVQFDRKADSFAVVAANKFVGQLPFTRLDDSQPGRIDGSIPISGTTASGYVAALLDPETLSLTNIIAADFGFRQSSSPDPQRSRRLSSWATLSACAESPPTSDLRLPSRNCSTPPRIRSRSRPTRPARWCMAD